MTEDSGWVVIPDFPLYEMNRLEKVRKFSNKQTVYRRSGKFYSLWQDGKLVTRSSKILYDSTFPEEEVVAPEPTYLDRLYVQFGQSMSHEHLGHFMNLTRERKDYLFDLWLKKNGYV